MAIKGSLKEASLPDVVQLLFLGRRTGCLSVASDRNFGSVWFDEGWITFASMVSRTDRIGERLVAAGKVSIEHLEEAIASQAAMPGRRIGEILVHLGRVTAGDLADELRRQVEETVYTLFAWTSGTFSFEVTPQAEAPKANLRLNPEGLLLEGARRVDEWSVIAKKITTVDAVYALEGEPRGTADNSTQLVESAWSYQHRPATGPEIKKRQGRAGDETIARAWAAQVHLTAKFKRLSAVKSSRNIVVTAVARELAGFLWAEMVAA